MLTVTVSAAIYFGLIANLTVDADISPVILSNGDDTSTCGGSLSTNATQVTFTSIPLAVESNITITELVNVTNGDTSAHDVSISVNSEDFGTSLSTLSLYLVSPSSTETLVIQLDDSGDVTTEDITVSVPASEEYAIKLIGCYDSGTSTLESNTMTLALQVTN
jgi:hypothetical protein